MRKYLLAAVAAAAFATPATARDNSGYVGIDAGILFPRNQDIEAAIDFTTPPDGVTDFATADVGRARWKNGYDVDLRGGYDFGMFRLEGELGYKRAKGKDLRLDDNFLVALNSGAGTSLTSDDFDLGHVSVLSGMVNALLDFGGNDGVGGFVGAGAGYARVKEFSDSDSGFAWQVLAGVYTPLSDNIDIGIKYRYFSTGNLHTANDVAFAAGTGACAPGGPPCSGGVATFGVHDKFTSHSVLASLTYNFFSPAPPPPPPPPPATQVCADGTTVLATDTCPMPPPPPPPLPPAPERG